MAAGSLPVQARRTAAPPRAAQPTAAPVRAALDQYCVTCHNARLKTAGLLLDQLDVDRPGDAAESWEKVARKLRTGEMPPPGRPRPDAASYTALAASIENALDEAS